MDAFKVPTNIPQDLLLIQELVGVEQPTVQLQKTTQQADVSSLNEDEDINSSDEENLSEEEIAADLITSSNTDDDDLKKAGNKPLSDSTSETSSDDSDSDSDAGAGAARASRVEIEVEDDEDPVAAPASATYFQTKHEVQEVEVPIPEVDEVGNDEALELVGEVMNIVDRVAIVRGLSAPENSQPGRGLDTALDSDTLLVFDDRKVMGFIYETFGPTSQPLYQVKFSPTFPLDPERVRVGRQVFHVPTRSRFVFVNQIKHIKGSDASNVHDEEPADDELEFSDDEAEAAYRSRLKRKRGESRARSTAPSSRSSTPNSTLMRDQELADEVAFGRGAYDEHGPYDIDYTMPGPSSRPPPIPYDDPYGDDYTAPDVADREAAASTQSKDSKFRSGHAHLDGTQSSDTRLDLRRGTDRSNARRNDTGPQGRGRDRDRGRGGRGRDRDGGRGRGRGRDHGERRDRVERSPQQSRPQTSGSFGDASYDSRSEPNRSLSPTSAVIARATGQTTTYPQPALGQSQQFFYQQQQQQQQQQHAQQQRNLSQQQHFGMLAGDAGGNQSWGYAPQFMPQFGAYMQQGYQQRHGYPKQPQNQSQQPQQPGYGDFSMGMFPSASAHGPSPFGVQPHINPRFASQFGLGMPHMQAHGVGAGVGTAAGGSRLPEAPTSSSSPAPFSSASLSAPSSEWTIPTTPSSSSTPVPGLNPSASSGEAN